MRIRNYQQMARELKADPKRFKAELREGLEAKHLRPEDFSIKSMAEHFVEDGREFVSLLNPAHGGLTEAGLNAVNTAEFSNITGQVIYPKVMDSFNDEQFVFTQTIPTVSTSFISERIPGVSPIGDQAAIVGEGEAYRAAGLNSNHIDTPQTVKRGLKVMVTKEAVFFDRTNLILGQAAEVGHWLGVNKEKRAIDCVIDENTTVHRYKWRGNVIATYGDSSGTHSWDNLSASTALVDWTDIDALEQLLGAMTHPDSGEPIMVMADTIIVTPQLVHTARNTINATMIRLQAGGFATSGNLYQTESNNPLGGGPFSATYKLLTSRLLPARLGTDTSWFLGNPARAFAYMENFPLAVEQAVQNSELSFNNDIIAQFKASERGAYATIEPRYMAKATA